MQKYLNCVVPFIDSVEPSTLLRLRSEEEEAFIRFRNALTRAVEEYSTQGATFTERDALAVYADIIQPKISELEGKLRKAERLFAKDSRRKLIGWVGAISVGLYTGFLSGNPLAGSAAFGATKVGAELLDRLMAKSDTEEAVMDDDLYFLWKVKKLADKKSKV